MRRFALILALVAIAFLGWKGFEAYRTQQATREAVNRIAPLVDYRDLYENGRDREANDVLLKTVTEFAPPQTPQDRSPEKTGTGNH